MHAVALEVDGTRHHPSHILQFPNAICVWGVNDMRWPDGQTDRSRDSLLAVSYVLCMYSNFSSLASLVLCPVSFWL